VQAVRKKQAGARDEDVRELSDIGKSSGPHESGSKDRR
jgi:hypothetical protein